MTRQHKINLIQKAYVNNGYDIVQAHKIAVKKVDELERDRIFAAISSDRFDSLSSGY